MNRSVQTAGMTCHLLRVAWDHARTVALTRARFLPGGR
ncbi:hypothetical protein A8924_3203 [Saccharopolyspora erythraea NRRL 2338]|nr:hypothetical protein A8924_3203 [Saccharopolyspora erythraea NRRL 2338]